MLANAAALVIESSIHWTVGRTFDVVARRALREAGWLARNDPDTETMGRELQLPPRSPAMV